MLRNVLISLFITMVMIACNQTPENSENVASNKTVQLARHILANTPEHIHFAEGTTFDWVWLNLDDEKIPENLKEVVIKQMREKYMVCLEESEIPDNTIVRDQDGNKIGYDDGFRFSFDVEYEGNDVVKINYSDWEGNLAASFHWKRYRWVKNHWKMIEKSDLLVS